MDKFKRIETVIGCEGVYRPVMVQTVNLTAGGTESLQIFTADDTLLAEALIDRMGGVYNVRHVEYTQEARKGKRAARLQTHSEIKFTGGFKEAWAYLRGLVS